MPKGKHFHNYDEARALVKLMGIRTSSEYNKRRKEDPWLPSDPNITYKGFGWKDWYEFLGNIKPDFYSYSEAYSAVHALGIVNRLDYKRCRASDSMLPGCPDDFYENLGWTSWSIFLNKKEKYNYEEARSAALKLDVKNRTEYFSRWREDERLPSNPPIFFRDVGWIDWDNFLGDFTSVPLLTFDEAVANVRSRGITTARAYHVYATRTPGLPRHPNLTYAKDGWTDWYGFLGMPRPERYSYSEAVTAVRDLGIESANDYKKRMSQDPKLPRFPNLFYATTGWIDWYCFLGKIKASSAIDLYPVLYAELDLWLKSQTNIKLKRTALKRLWVGVFHQLGLPDDARYILFRQNFFPGEEYKKFISSQSESMRRPYHTAITAFYGAMLDKYCVDEDAGDRVVLIEYRNPFLSAVGLESFQDYRPSQSTKAPLGYEYILRALQFLVPQNERVLQTQPTLDGLSHLHAFFDSRIDWIYVDEHIIDKNDPNCVWRFVRNSDRTIDGVRQIVDSYQIWSPVRFIALYTLLRYPLRGQQILWLDSGEADQQTAVLDHDLGIVRWESNKGLLVGRGSKKSCPQGVIQRGFKELPRIYVTTNKTGRSEGGYYADWIPDDLVYWLLFLRDWQGKYNPIKKPTAWTDISLRVETNENILKTRGTQCFLFRIDSSGQPLSTTSAFTHLLPALLFKIQRTGENLAILNPDRRLNSQRYLSDYTPHSLRVSIITAYIADGDAPIHLISKLVGHRSLVMTIYYVKLNSYQMRRAIGEAEKRAGKAACDRQADLIRKQGLKPFRSQLITTDGNRVLVENDVPNSACVVFDYGICPMSAACCHVGGERMAERKVEIIYAPVEGGYLGQKNCARCRFFVTGIPFLGGLVALSNEIALEIHTESGRFQEFAAEFERLEQDFFDVCLANRLDTQESQRKQVGAYQQQSASKLDNLLNDYSAVFRYVRGCLSLVNEGDKKDECEGVKLIAASDPADFGIEFQEARTQYHLLAEICQNATIYKATNASRAVPLISQAIDRMAANNNLAPALFRLTDEHKLVVINQLNNFLLQRLGSWERIDSLFSGDLMLLDVDSHDPLLTPITDAVQNLLTHGSLKVENEKRYE